MFITGFHRPPPSRPSTPLFPAHQYPSGQPGVTPPLFLPARWRKEREGRQGAEPPRSLDTGAYGGKLGGKGRGRQGKGGGGAHPPSSLRGCANQPNIQAQSQRNSPVDTELPSQRHLEGPPTLKSTPQSRQGAPYRRISRSYRPENHVSRPSTTPA